MVYVPWQDLGICKFWAMHKTTCDFVDTCKWAHPREEELKRVWDHYAGLEFAAQGNAVPPRLPPPPPPPIDGPQCWPKPPPAVVPHDLPPRPLSTVPRENLPPRPAPMMHPDRMQLNQMDGANDTLPPRPRLPPAPPYCRESSIEVQPSWYGTMRMDGAHDELPPISSPPLTLRENSRHHLEQNDQKHHLRPPSGGETTHWNAERPTFHPDGYSGSGGRPHQHQQWAEEEDPYWHPHDDPNPYKERKEYAQRQQAQAEYGFDPHQSRNSFVNGSRVYKFVWGDPLCVRCGMMGHLPRQCKEEELSKMEQDFLYRIVKEEKARSEADRQIMQPSAGSGPHGSSDRSTSVPEEREGKEVSMSDAPPSPRNGGKAGPRRPYGPQSEYWKQYKAKQQEKRHPSPQMDTPMSAGTAKQRDDDGDPHEMIRRRLKQKHDARAQQTNDKVEAAGNPRPRPRPPDVTYPESERDVSTATEQRVPSNAVATHTPTPSLEAFVPLPFGSKAAPAMGATKRTSHGEAKVTGPHPSTIRVSAPYITQSAVEKRLQPAGLDAQERSIQEAREDSVRLQGVTWLDQVRRALQLPVKTFTTACVYYHKFRLSHHTLDYAWADAAAASLLTSCKNEDTLKKSRDILAAAYNLKQTAGHEQVGADDAIFEGPSRVVIGLERLVLESGGFDFRSRSPHHTLVKVSKSLPRSEDLRSTSQLAWTILTDLHRTFAVLKQTSATLALASLELAAHFIATTSDNNTCTVRDDLQMLNLDKWHTTREEVMETLLDALDLYTHHTTSTILGNKYSLDDFLRIRLALNKECSESSLPRFTVVQPPPSPDNVNGTSSSTLRVSNGHPTPVSPPQGGTQAPQPANANTPNLPPIPEGGGTLRFMLNPVRATDERTQVNRYYTEEWEEYEEEIEVPMPRARSRSRDRDRRRDAPPERPERDRASGRPSRDYDDRRGTRDSPRAPIVDRAIERDRERTRTSDRDRDRDRRYDDRRDSRRYDDRRDRDGYRDRRDYDDRRRDRR